MTPEELEKLVSELRRVSAALADGTPPPIGGRQVTRVRSEIRESAERIQRVLHALDPIKHPGFVFDPSNPEVVGRIVAIALVAQDRKPLEAIAPFYGSGVYALYYNGRFEGYKRISKKEHPIYVGKADPADPSAKTPLEQGSRLSGRVTEHMKNIAKATETLKVSEFEYRALVVQTGWEASAEKSLIRMFKPIWNNETGICYGFGKHGDSSKTRANQRSPWDTLHHGRAWAHGDEKITDAKPRDAILEEINEHLSRNPPLQGLDAILKKFLDEMKDVT